MKPYTKSLNIRSTSASAKAIGKIILGALSFIGLICVFAAAWFFHWLLPFELPLASALESIFVFFFLWLGIGGFIDFVPINDAKEIEDALKDGPVSFSNVCETMGKGQGRVLRSVSELKRRRLFKSVAVLEDCIVFERGDDARPLMLMADKDMRFFEGRKRFDSFELVLLPLLMGLNYIALNTDLYMRTPAYFPGLLLTMAVTFGVMLLLGMIRRPRFAVGFKRARTLAPEETVIEMPKSGDGEADALIDTAAEHIHELTLLDDAIQDEYVSERIREISVATRQLIEFLRQNPHKQSQAKQLIEYALPTTIKLLKQYDYLNGQPVKGENIQKSMAKIKEMSDTVAATMKRELDALYAEGSIDIEVDIEVMTSMLNQETTDFKID